MNKKIKEASDLTNKLISDAVKNLQSNNDDYITDYFAELILSVKAELSIATYTNVKSAIKNEIKISPSFMTSLDSAIVFARRVIYFNLVLRPETAWRLP